MWKAWDSGGSFLSVANLLGLVVTVSVIAGCQSTQKADPPKEPVAAAPAPEAEKKGSAVERKQMDVDVRVEGADAQRKGDTITLDYPVLQDRNDQIPDWVINPGLDGVLGAVGVAAKGKLGTKEQLLEARLSGRLELAQTLELRLQKVGRTQLEQQWEAFGSGLSEDSRKSILEVDRNIADVVLAGTRQRALWFDPETEECFVWMVLDGAVLEKVDHYVQDDVSIFVANTPIAKEYRPERRQPEAPTVVVEVPEEAPKPEPPKEPIEKLEEHLSPIETIPLKTDGDGTTKEPNS